MYLWVYTEPVKLFSALLSVLMTLTKKFEKPKKQEETTLAYFGQPSVTKNFF
jgi:hypothetical protein